MWLKSQHGRSEWLYIQHAMQSWFWKSRQGQAAAARPGKRIRTKKVTFKLQQGLNFTVDVEFGFATIISVKLPQGKKNAYFVVFFYQVKNGHFCSCTNWKGDSLQESWLFCVYWIFQFEGHSTQCSKLTVKAMFKRLRKLQCVSKQCM